MSIQLNSAFSLLLSAIVTLHSGTPLAESRISSHLQQLQNDYARHQGNQEFSTQDATLNVISSTHVMLTITSTKELVDKARIQLQNLGMTHIAQYKHLISGVLQIDQLEKLQAISSVHWASSHRAISSASGLAYNAGDAAMFSDVVKKQQGVDGTGVKIGVLSDSYNCLKGEALDVQSGDLPSDVRVIKEYSFCDVNPGSDEGRAMMQLIYDIAPGAKLLFYTAFEGPVSFAQGIIELANQGADIIVDDVGYLTMPMVQDGPIAQAVNEVNDRGVTYFSAAGNSSRQSYQNFFVAGLVQETRYTAHDFGLAAGAASDFFQKIIIPKDTNIRISLQWDAASEIANGYVGADSDLDMFLLDSEKNRIVAKSEDSNIGHDPVEFLSFTSDPDSENNTYYLFLRHSAGKIPMCLKYVVYAPGLGKVERTTKLTLSKTADGYTFFHHNNEVMTDGSAVIVIPGVDTQFQMINITELELKIEEDEQLKPFITFNGKIYLDDQAIWFVPNGATPVVLRNGELVLVNSEEDLLTTHIANYNTHSGTIFGHANAEGAIAVGAMSYRQAPWFNGDSFIESFSSAGGTPILFNVAGDRLAELEFRAKPEIVAIDDIDTTFFPFIAEETDTDLNGLPNFKGTSAAAPNAAAVAALLLQKYSYLKPTQVKQVMMHGTIDLIDPANVQNEVQLATNPCAQGVQFDWGTGCGLIQLDLMFEAANHLFLTGLGDLNKDGCVNSRDSAILVAVLRSSTEMQRLYDLTGDGKITDRDFNALLALYDGECTQ